MVRLRGERGGGGEVVGKGVDGVVDGFSGGWRAALGGEERGCYLDGG